MIKPILHKLHIAIQLTLVTLLLTSCFVIDRTLFNGIITAKGLWVQALTVIAIVYVVVQAFRVKKLHITIIDVLVTSFAFFMVCRDGFNNLPHANASNYVLNITLFYCLYLFFRFLGKYRRVTQWVITSYLLIVAVQAGIGLLQLYGVLNSYHSLFKITGTFHNPGPFSGFVASGLQMAVGLYLGTRISIQSEVSSNQCSVISAQFWLSLNWVKILNYFAQFVIVVLLLVLPAARSRAAWLGGIIGCLYVLWFYKEYISFYALQKITASIKKILCGSFRKIFVFFAILIFVFTLFGLYKFKQGSADGRLLMWQVSWEMIKDKPIGGWGQGGFEANYANYQAEWFKSGKGTKVQELVAGSPGAPFNELIRVAVNYGLVGVILVLALLVFLLRRGTQRTAESQKDYLHYSVLLKGGLISILIFSLFSYPLDVTPILVQLILLVALIANQSTELVTRNIQRNLYNHNPISNTLIARLMVFTMLVTIIPLSANSIKNKYLGLAHWQEANTMYKYELYNDASDEFELALQYLPKEGLLLQMHTKCYTMCEQWEEAINTAKQAQNYASGPILNIVLGDAYKAQGNYEKSEKAYKYASSMIPHKFFPKYLLTKMYYESGQGDKAVKLANELLNKEIKIESTAIQEMRSELMNIINTREKEQEAAVSQNVALPVRPPFQNEERRFVTKIN